MILTRLWILVVGLILFGIVFALNSAKTSATKVARIVKYRDKILAGKGALDR